MTQPLLAIRKVVKRDGSVVEFDRSKFDSAVERAADEIGREVSFEAVYEAALGELQPLLMENPDSPVHAEQVLDAIEVGLMDSGYTDVAKSFIRYRHRRDRRRELGSGYSRTISDINMDFEIRGNVERWLWTIGKAAAAQYISLAEMPVKVSRSVSENYLSFPEVVGYGRTVERASFSAETLLSSRYLEERNITKANRLIVAMNHLVSLNAAAAADIAGEQCYYGFDTDMGNVARELRHTPDDDDYRQATQTLAYSLNAGDARGERPGLSITLGLDGTAEGLKFSKSLLDALAKAHREGVDVRNPHVVFLVSEDSNYDEGSPGRELFESAVTLATSRGGVSFVWAEDYSHAYFSDGVRVPAGECVSLRVDVNAPKLVAEAGSEFYEVFDILVDAIDAAVQKHDAGIASKGEGNFPAMSRFVPEAEGWSFQRSLAGQKVLVGVVGLGEAARILDPNREGLDSTARLSRVLAKRLRKRLMLQDERYVLYPQSDLTVARRLYERDRVLMSETYGIGSYLPSPSVLPLGYPVTERLNVESETYSAFTSTGVVMVDREKGRPEVLAGIEGVREIRAVLSVVRG